MCNVNVGGGGGGGGWKEAFNRDARSTLMDWNLDYVKILLLSF